MAGYPPSWIIVSRAILNIGVIITVFHIAGILDVEIEILNMHDNGYEI